MLAGCLSLSAAAQPLNKSTRLSPLTRKYLAEYKALAAQQLLPEGYVYRKSAQGEVYISALLKVGNPALAEAGLRNIGAHTGTRAGSIWTVQLPVDRVGQLALVNGIDYVQLDEAVVFPQLNAARTKTRVDSVHGGYNLPMPYTGKDVIVGVIDFGFDYNHPTLYDTLGTTYRLSRVWELNTNGTPPSGYTYGHEITDTNAIKAQGTDNAEQSHGSFVSGMAAGSGYGGDNTHRKYRGMAFDAEMVFVGVRRDWIGGQWMSSGFSDFIDGINYIFTCAQSVGKPAVVNISWGSQSGPHDGSSLFNQACDALTGAGKLVVLSAGNDGQDLIHLSKTFSTTDTAIHTFLSFNPTHYKRTWVDVWGDTGKTFCARVTLYNNNIAGNTTGYFCIDDQVHDTFLLSNNGLDTCFVQFITSSSEFNSKPRTIVNIFNKTGDDAQVSVSGTDGAIDMWNEYYYYGFPQGFQSWFSDNGNNWATTGNTISTVSDMGASESVLLVGAYCSKNSFTDINGNNMSYNNYVPNNGLVPFSSRGPYVDGRIKPDITAPGLTVGTSVTSYDTSFTATGSNSDLTLSEYTDMSNNKYYYAEFMGTSASAPAASGILALLLQVDPTLTPQAMKTLLFNTALKDVYTGNLPQQGNNNWGRGKINAYGAVKALIQQLGVYQYAGTGPDCILYPNPGEGLFTLDYTASKAEEATIEVVSITGNVMYADVWKVAAGLNRRTLDLSRLAKGNYVVKIASRDGSAVIKATIK